MYNNLYGNFCQPKNRQISQQYFYIKIGIVIQVIILIIKYNVRP